MTQTPPLPTDTPAPRSSASDALRRKLRALFDDYASDRIGMVSAIDGAIAALASPSPAAPQPQGDGRILGTVLRILDGGLTGDERKVRAYAEMLAAQAEEAGDGKYAARLRSMLTEPRRTLRPAAAPPEPQGERVRMLEDALRKHGEHRPACAVPMGVLAPCDCGLADALALSGTSTRDGDTFGAIAGAIQQALDDALVARDSDEAWILDLYETVLPAARAAYLAHLRTPTREPSAPDAGTPTEEACGTCYGEGVETGDSYGFTCRSCKGSGRAAPTGEPAGDAQTQEVEHG